MVITYPSYLEGKSDAVKDKFDAWAATFGSRDPDGVYTNAFLLNVATNLPAADWKDVESGRYVDEKGAFLRCLIDFEHTLTPGTFPAKPEGTKTIKVFVR